MTKKYKNIEKMMKKYKNYRKNVKKYKKEENPKELPRLTPVAPESINTDPSPVVTEQVSSDPHLESSVSRVLCDVSDGMLQCFLVLTVLRNLTYFRPQKKSRPSGAIFAEFD